jgi:hypothetical protein
MKNKNFQILEIGTFRPLLVKIISKTVKDRGNLSTYYRKHLTQSIQQQKNYIKIEWKIKILYTFQICYISDIGPLLDPFRNKVANFFNVQQ